jgi:hypothetical protein
MSKNTGPILPILLLASAGATAAEHWEKITSPDGEPRESVDSMSIDFLPSGIRRAKIKEDCQSARRGCESIVRVELFECDNRSFTIESAERRQVDGTVISEGRPPSMPPSAPAPWFHQDPNPILDYVCLWKPALSAPKTP